MIIKILGILDIIAGFALFLHRFLPENLIMFFGIYLLVKGIMFAMASDIISFVDIACAIAIIISLNVALPQLIISLAGIFLIQKGIFSLIS